MIQPAMILPHDLQRRIINTFGDKGASWVKDFPGILRHVAARWSLTPGTPYQGLSYNFVAPVQFDTGEKAVLKLGVPNTELTNEIAALSLYNGAGMVRLIDADPQMGIILMEQLHPGSKLSVFFPENDDQATIIAAKIMKQLWRTPDTNYPFPTIQKWLSGFTRLRAHFNGETGPFPSKIVKEAENRSKELLGSMDHPVLLHGDLHHFNILAAERQPWLAIDPKGVIGEPAYDVGALIRNPIPDILTTNALNSIFNRRVDVLADRLQLDKQRIASWAFVQSVLSVWWFYEENDPVWHKWLPFTQQLAKLLK